MTKTSGFALIEVLVVVVIVAVIGGGLYVWQQANQPADSTIQSNVSDNPTPTPATQSTQDTYTNTACHYSLVYPVGAEAYSEPTIETCGAIIEHKAGKGTLRQGPIFDGSQGYYLVVQVSQNPDGKSVYQTLVDNQKMNNDPEQMGYWDINTLKPFQFQNTSGYTFKGGDCPDGCGYQIYVAQLPDNRGLLYIYDQHSPNQIEAKRIISSLKVL